MKCCPLQIAFSVSWLPVEFRQGGTVEDWKVLESRIVAPQRCQGPNP